MTKTSLEYQREWTKNNKDRIREYVLKNKEKYNKNRRERWKNDPEYREKRKSFQLKQIYGITIEEYNKLVFNQNGLCLICKSPPTNNRKSDKLYVDHSHITGKVRGLLCHKCNNGLGCFNDNRELMLQAINYLKDEE